MVNDRIVVMFRRNIILVQTKPKETNTAMPRAYIYRMYQTDSLHYIMLLVNHRSYMYI